MTREQRMQRCAEAFDGVISNRAGPDHWAAENAADALGLDEVLERLEKAESAARDFAACLANLAVSGAFRDGSGGMVRVAKALARHPEHAPGPSPNVPTVNQ